ncbi:MAG TPA: tetratricopeptide repeat protein [Phycisphaerales bacterium]|nr:tetratricopeptide repeat protein [Phycisphaerales bacterium]
MSSGMTPGAGGDPIAAQLAHVDALVRAGKTKDAFIIAKSLAERHADNFACVRAAVLTAHAAGDVGATVSFLRQAVAMRSADVGLRLNLAKALHEYGDTDAALKEIEQAVSIGPATPMMFIHARQMLAFEQRYMEGRAWLDRGLAIFPRDVGLNFSRATEHLRLGEYEKALPMYDSLIAIAPHMAFFYLDRAYAMNYLPHVDAKQVLDAHRACGQFLDMAPDMSALWAGRNRDPNRRLRVGFLGPDFFRHSVAYFVEGLFEHLSRDRCSVYAYYTNRQRDGVTDRLERAADVFRHVEQEKPDVLTQIILRDEIDVLIDLAGYTNVHGVTVMAARPAPVLATYCGYPNTTGSSRIGWRIVDSVTDPAGSEQYATESLLRIDPCFLCYRPEVDAPEVAAAPHVRKGFVTFGSFNAQRKFNRVTCGLWRDVLARVPGSRLAIKSINFTEAASIEFAREQLREYGLPIERVDVLPAAKTAREHLAQYGEVDIGLDTYPYHGTTTTCEALWMGVPVVTMTGDRHASRVGTSLLSCVGLQDWIATSPDRYVEIARRAASDGAGLRALRASLRERMATSALCDQAGFARKFEGAVRRMWEAWAAAK